MGLFGLVFVGVALVLIGIGIAIGATACLVAPVLVGLGVISSSFFVGILTGRPSVGFRAFLLQCGIFIGIPAGAICAWLGHHFYAVLGSDLPILFFGATGGAFAGVIVALMLDFISGRLGARAGARMRALRVPTAQPLPEKRG